MPTTPELVIVAYTRSEVDRVAIQKAATGLLDAGLEPAGDGPRVEYAAKDGYTDSSDRDTALSSTAAAEIVDNGRGEVVFSLDDFEFQCSLIVAPDVVDVPSVRMSVPEPAVTADDADETAATRRANTIVDAVEAVAVATDPWGVVTITHGENGVVGELPERPPAEAELSKLVWLTVFGPEWCDHLGGRDRLLDTPAWNTRELPNGAVLVRRTERPDTRWYPSSVPGEGQAITPTDYVFQGWTTTDPDELRAQQLAESERTHLDPFRSLEEGEYADDICQCKHHSSLVEETAPTDYRGLLENDLDFSDRCQMLAVRRRDDKLWIQPSGQFLRRLVDDDGIPIGDLPDGVPPEDEMLSMTILLDSQRENPPSWYTTDDPDDKSIATRVNRGIRRTPNSSIWKRRDESR